MSVMALAVCNLQTKPVILQTDSLFVVKEMSDGRYVGVKMIFNILLEVRLKIARKSYDIFYQTNTFL